MTSRELNGASFPADLGLGLGAVVEDASGEWWTLWNDWMFRSRSAPYVDKPYEEIGVTRVVSHGL